MDKHIAYREAIDAVTEASNRYHALVNDPIITEPVAQTVEGRKVQYRKWSAEKKRRQPALIAASDTLNAACEARDAAFAALNG